MEKKCPKRNILVCISALAALNLGIVMVAGNLPIPFLSFDSVVQRVNAQAQPVYVMDVYKANYRFLSCMGGDSVNCHKHGNQAGL